jgi:hypothetical protein
MGASFHAAGGGNTFAHDRAVASSDEYAPGLGGLGAVGGARAGDPWRNRLGIQGLATRSEQTHALDFRFTASAIWGYIILLRHHLGMASGILWTHRHGKAGYALLVTGAFVLVIAAFGSRSRRIDIVSTYRPVARWVSPLAMVVNLSAGRLR